MDCSQFLTHTLSLHVFSRSHLQQLGGIIISLLQAPEGHTQIAHVIWCAANKGHALRQRITQGSALKKILAKWKSGLIGLWRHAKAKPGQTTRMSRSSRVENSLESLQGPSILWSSDIWLQDFAVASTCSGHLFFVVAHDLLPMRSPGFFWDAGSCKFQDSNMSFIDTTAVPALPDRWWRT